MYNAQFDKDNLFASIKCIGSINTLKTKLLTWGYIQAYLPAIFCSRMSDYPGFMRNENQDMLECTIMTQKGLKMDKK